MNLVCQLMPSLKSTTQAFIMMSLCFKYITCNILPIPYMQKAYRVSGPILSHKNFLGPNLELGFQVAEMMNLVFLKVLKMATFEEFCPFLGAP